MKITDEMVLRGLNTTARLGSEAPDLSYWSIEATAKMRAALEAALSIPPADDAREAVNAAVVLAALAQMEEVAADRQQLQSVKLSILRRRIASLQRQIENQAAEVRPHGTVTDAEVDAAQRVLDARIGLGNRSITRAALEAAREVHP